MSDSVSEQYILEPDDVFPIFHSNNWGSSWRNGVFTFHHYHSTDHRRASEAVERSGLRN